MENLELKYKKDTSLIWGIKKPVLSEIGTAEELTLFINIDYIKQYYNLRQTVEKDGKREFTNRWDVNWFTELVRDALNIISIYDIRDTALLYYDFRKYTFGGEAKLGQFIECIGKFFPKMRPISNSLASEIINKCKRNYQIESCKLNDYVNLLNTNEGILNLEILPVIEIIPHSPKFYFTYCIPRRLKEDKDIEERIHNFLSNLVSKDDLIVLYELAVYLFVPCGIHKKGIITLGLKDAGKSAYTSFLTNMIGSDLKKDLTIHDLAKDPFAKSELANIFLLIDDDISSKQLSDTSTLKILLGTKDRYINANKKHSGYIKFLILFKLFGNANKLPDIHKDQREDSFFSRWWIIPFINQFVKEPDPTKPHQKKAMPEGETLDFIRDSDILDVFFTKILEFYPDVLKNGITESKSIIDIQDQWLMSSNTIYSYFKEMLEDDDDYYVHKDDNYNQYKLYCTIIEEDAEKQSKFTEELNRISKFYQEFRPEEMDKRPYSIKGLKFSNRITKDLEKLPVIEIDSYKNKRVKKSIPQKKLLD